MIKVYMDASTKGNPGLSGGGILIVHENRQEQLKVPLSEGSNHQAEFEVFLKTLTILKEKGLTKETILCYSDSKVLVSTIDKDHTSNQNFISYFQAIQTLLSEFTLLILQWIPESKNKGADHLARQALQALLDKEAGTEVFNSEK
ncbi:ribonuclease HI family protein [Enterococcus durans]|uniref:Ribonuclease HI n=1 Tax=Enterococcus durans TaxID=53345 RepID=A0A377KP07_9ENTE|nr:ribonuclease HI family protein [Enterococcus durans]ASV96092.1 ribonuclease HI [Enterococcus durans]MBX9040026.1 ribonuclease HI family protein [Enterococcus durans]MBX9077305.1 ribonuclease HI family protein [Enterococcus durans]MCB8504401.1 ribonuclease HI family protein [Enterococcus durans]MCB8516567.1 ribonuclease HI family protein [Enterococcus durans]